MSAPDWSTYGKCPKVACRALPGRPCTDARCSQFGGEWRSNPPTIAKPHRERPKA